MLRLGLGALLLHLNLVYIALGASSDVARPYELIVHRRSETEGVRENAKCTHLALRETQRFRALPDEGFLKRTSEPAFGEERIQYVAREREDVWARAEEMCGESGGWDFHTLVQKDLWSGVGDLDSASQQDASEQVVFGAGGPGSVGAEDPPLLEVEPLIVSGDSSNRVDLTFFADGYTWDEKNKFYEDARRLAEDISGNQTFYTVKPLLNFWAAFTPSAESGIGVGGRPKDTAFGLYRDGTELRGVYYSKPELARSACFSLGDQCDYPILMGNDPLYGGLGGQFTVITPSLANGPLVLRHELGHSIIGVGEEYDGGFAYSGVNAAHGTKLKSIPWAHWLTNASYHKSAHDHAHGSGEENGDGSAPKEARVERSVMPLQDYAWTMLNTSASWSTSFTSAGTYAWHIVRFSLSGIPKAEDLLVELDGKDLGWVPREDIGVDRWHYDIKVNTSLQGGEHNVTFTLKNKKREGEAQLCSVEVLEFGNEDEFVSSPGHYGLFPTFSEKNETSYRPTNEDCLMRVVTTPNFCKACIEGLWYALLRRVALIDDLVVGCTADGEQRTLDLALVPLAQFRESPVDVDEGYEVTWTKDGLEVPEWANATAVVDDGEALGAYVVKVRYWTEEVRVDRDGLLESYTAAVVTTRC